MAPKKPLSPDAVRQLIARTANLGLIDEDDELLGGNEGERRANSSAFGDIFGFLARPSRAIAGGVNAAVDEDPRTNVGSSVLAGLLGRETNTFSDVLGNLGVDNKYARSIGGFGLDVLADPLTYVGVKSIKGVSKAEARMRAVQELSKKGDELTEDAVSRTANTLAQLDPGHTYVSFAGKRVSPNFETPNLVGRAAKEKIIGGEDQRRFLARSLSRRSELPFGMADSARVYEAENTGKFMLHDKAVRQTFSPLTPDEQRQVTHAIESGTDLGDQPIVRKDKAVNGMTTLGEYQGVAQRLLKQYFDDEAGIGLYKAEQYNPNYVYKYFRKGLAPTKPGLPAAATARGRAGNEASKIEILARAQEQGVEGQQLLDTLVAGDPKKMTLEQARNLGLDPVEEIGEMLGLRSAKHYRTIGRQSFVRDAVENFGVKLNSGNRNFLIDNKYRPAKEYLAAPVAQAEDIADLYIPDHIAKAINGTESVLRDGQIGAEWMKWYDKIVGGWKSLNTMYNPGYHMRNAFSDSIINYMDGVHNPSLYGRAWRTMTGARTVDAADILGLPTEVSKAVGHIKVGRNQLTADDVWKLYLQGGSKTGFITSELGPSLDDAMKEGWARAADKTQMGVRGAANWIQGGVDTIATGREDFFRLAHHIKAMEDNLPKNRVATPEELAAASKAAGERVRKYNIDYGMLSTAEKNIVRRVIPFYGWMRRNLPLQVELMFTKPGYMAAYAKGQDLMQGVLGTDNGEGDYMIPKWIRDSLPVRTALADNEKNTFLGKLVKKMAGAGEGEPVFLPLTTSMTPMGDLANIVDPIAKGREEGVGQGILEAAKIGVNMATPVAKIPVEAATQRSLYTGKEISKSPGGWKGWLMNQVGPTRAGSRAVSGDERFLTSWTTGLNLQPVTGARQAGEYRRREDVLDSRIRRAKMRGLAARGIEDPTEKQYDRFRNPDIRRMQKYKKNTLRIIGSINPEDESI